MVTQIFLIPNYIPPPVPPPFCILFFRIFGVILKGVLLSRKWVFFFSPLSLSLLGSEDLSGFGALFSLLALFFESFAGEIGISLCVAHFVFNFLTF
jgi:hypothetical protein